jgi:hypothetical protein
MTLAGKAGVLHKPVLNIHIICKGQMHEHPEYDVIMTEPDLNTPYILAVCTEIKAKVGRFVCQFAFAFRPTQTLRHEQSGTTLSASLTLSQTREFKV